MEEKGGKTEPYLKKNLNASRPSVWGTRSSMLDWALDAGLSCTKGVWYVYDWDTG